MRGSRPESFYSEKHKQSREERKDSPLIHVRTFNNFIKAALISTAVGDPDERRSELRVLDLAGGTGGDLSKYQHHKAVKDITLVDIAQGSVAEALKRFAGLKNTFRAVEFFCANGFSFEAMERIISKPATYDIVSCQFALHYAAKNTESLSEALKVISFALKSGGTFIVTVPNAQFIVDTVDDNGKLETSTFTIQFPPGPDLRSEYLFSMGEAVQNVPEYLLLRETLEEAGNLWGLQLVHWTPFPAFFTSSMHNPKLSGLAQKLGCAVPSADALATAKLYVAFQMTKQ